MKNIVFVLLGLILSQYSWAKTNTKHYFGVKEGSNQPCELRINSSDSDPYKGTEFRLSVLDSRTLYLREDNPFVEFEGQTERKNIMVLVPQEDSDAVTAPRNRLVIQIGEKGLPQAYYLKVTRDNFVCRLKGYSGPLSALPAPADLTHTNEFSSAEHRFSSWFKAGRASGCFDLDEKLRQSAANNNLKFEIEIIPPSFLVKAGQFSVTGSSRNIERFKDDFENYTSNCH